VVKYSYLIQKKKRLELLALKILDAGETSQNLSAGLKKSSRRKTWFPGVAKFDDSGDETSEANVTADLSISAIYPLPIEKKDDSPIACTDYLETLISKKFIITELPQELQKIGTYIQKLEAEVEEAKVNAQIANIVTQETCTQYKDMEDFLQIEKEILNTELGLIRKRAAETDQSFIKRIKMSDDEKYLDDASFQLTFHILTEALGDIFQEATAQLKDLSPLLNNAHETIDNQFLEIESLKGLCNDYSRDSIIATKKAEESAEKVKNLASKLQQTTVKCASYDDFLKFLRDHTNWETTLSDYPDFNDTVSSINSVLFPKNEQMAEYLLKLKSQQQKIEEILNENNKLLSERHELERLLSDSRNDFQSELKLNESLKLELKAQIDEKRKSSVFVNDLETRIRDLEQEKLFESKSNNSILITIDKLQLELENSQRLCQEIADSKAISEAKLAQTLLDLATAHEQIANDKHQIKV
jgi:hypothetical protein